MIFDKIEYWNYYFKHPIFKEIFEKLTTLSEETLDGIYYKNEDYYFKVLSYKTKRIADIVENHQKEVDIQIVLKGKEQIDVYDENAVKSIRPYEEKEDCEFYEIIGEAHSKLILEKGFMSVFFQQDIHNPQICINQKEEIIKKIVIKVNEKFFTQP
ncbi:MAG: YhcH/YjgK/YiaL family protein [Flavobacteriaceae bacterium]|nr:YhcH/YjgK/YiaL family protein [Flavobacteriaceae bacterium]